MYNSGKCVFSYFLFTFGHMKCSFIISKILRNQPEAHSQLNITAKHLINTLSVILINRIVCKRGNRLRNQVFIILLIELIVWDQYIFYDDKLE